MFERVRRGHALLWRRWSQVRGWCGVYCWCCGPELVPARLLQLLTNGEWRSASRCSPSRHFAPSMLAAVERKSIVRASPAAEFQRSLARESRFVSVTKLFEKKRSAANLPCAYYHAWRLHNWDKLNKKGSTVLSSLKRSGGPSVRQYRAITVYPPAMCHSPPLVHSAPTESRGHSD